MGIWGYCWCCETQAQKEQQLCLYLYFDISIHFTFTCSLSLISNPRQANKPHLNLSQDAKKLTGFLKRKSTII